MSIQYHPGKANVVADVLSRKSYCHYLTTLNQRPKIAQEVHHLNLQIVPHGIINMLQVQPTLEEWIKEAQDKTRRYRDSSNKALVGKS